MYRLPSCGKSGPFAACLSLFHGNPKEVLTQPEQDFSGSLKGKARCENPSNQASSVRSNACLRWGERRPRLRVCRCIQVKKGSPKRKDKGKNEKMRNFSGWRSSELTTRSQKDWQVLTSTLPMGTLQAWFHSHFFLALRVFLFSNSRVHDGQKRFLHVLPQQLFTKMAIAQYGAAGLPAGPAASGRVPRVMNIALGVLMSVVFVCAVGTAVVWTPSSPTTELVVQQQAMVMVPIKQPDGQVIYVMQPGAQQQTLAASVQQPAAKPQPVPLKVAVAVPMEQQPQAIAVAAPV
jgi:hypothetical protein